LIGPARFTYAVWMLCIPCGTALQIESVPMSGEFATVVDMPISDAERAYVQAYTRDLHAQCAGAGCHCPNSTHGKRPRA
jgi:hypothetical protein